MKYLIAYTMMLVGFGYLGLTGPTVRDKLIGFICLILNAILFWRG
jgi:hypothetical protein